MRWTTGRIVMPGLKVRVRSKMFALLLMMFTLTAAMALDFGDKNNNDKDQAKTKTENKKNSKTPSDETSAQLAEKIYTADPSQYVGTDTCKTCHEDIGKTFDKGPHWKTLNDKHGVQWQGCEACHGPGKVVYLFSLLQYTAAEERGRVEDHTNV